MNNQTKATNCSRQLILLLILSTAYIAVYANIQGFKAMLPLVQEEFLISRTQVGLYSSFYFSSAVGIAIFSGRIADYLGTKRGLVLGVGALAVLLMSHSLAPVFKLILIMAFFTGTAFSLVTPSINKGVLEYSESTKRSFSMGIVHGGGAFGGFLGAIILPYLGEMLGWRTAILIGGIFALVIAIFIFKFFHPPRNYKLPEHQLAEESEAEKTSLKDDLLVLLRNRYLVSIFPMGIIFGMTLSTVAGHFSLYMAQDLGTSITFAGVGLGLFHIGGMIGQPFWGLMNERLFYGNRRNGLFLLGILVSALALFFGFGISNFYFSPYLVLFFVFLFGFCTLGIIAIYFTTVSELVPGNLTGVVNGLALIFPRTSQVFAPPLFGMIADFYDSYAPSWVLLGVLSLILTMIFAYFSGKYGLVPDCKNKG